MKAEEFFVYSSACLKNAWHNCGRWNATQHFGLAYVQA